MANECFAEIPSGAIGGRFLLWVQPKDAQMNSLYVG